jgi:hypothetical protein
MKYTEEQLIKLLSRSSAEQYESLNETEKIEFLEETLKELKRDNWYIRLFQLCVIIFMLDCFIIFLYITYVGIADVYFPNRQEYIFNTVIFGYLALYFFFILPFFRRRGLYLFFNFRRLTRWRLNGTFSHLNF